MNDISAAGAARPLTYTGRKREIARLSLGIGLLNLITLSIYRFWGTTRLRRYLWSHVSFDGHALEYIGRGSELFVGFLIAIVILIPAVLVIGGVYLFAASQGPLAHVVLQLLSYLAAFYLLYVALYRARRYRLSRTLWRGIRAGHLLKQTVCSKRSPDQAHPLSGGLFSPKISCPDLPGHPRAEDKSTAGLADADGRVQPRGPVRAGRF